MSRKSERRIRLLQASLAISVAVAAWLWLWPWAPWTGGVVAVLLLGLAHSRMILSPGAAILTYHSVSDDAGWLPWSDNITVSPRTFAAHLRTLRAMAVPVLATRDYVAMRQRGEAIPRRAVLLHFDDGYFDNWCHAVPLLNQYGFPATFFVSLNFIEPGDRVRQRHDRPGYMNWAELRAIESIPGFEVEPHGIDHARVAVAGDPVARLDQENWREHLWLQWAASPGPKHDWHERPVAWAIALGSLVPRSGLALAVPGVVDGVPQTEADLESRIDATLAACNERFVSELGRQPQIFCWPENKACAAGRHLASAHGYVATTGGHGRNIASEPVGILSRLHVPDRSLGFASPAGEALVLRALIGTMHGNLYWYPVLLAVKLVRVCVERIRMRRAPIHRSAIPYQKTITREQVT